MPKKPNFDFERREREKAKAAKQAEKARAKDEKRSDAAPVDKEPDRPAANDEQ